MQNLWKSTVRIMGTYIESFTLDATEFFINHVTAKFGLPIFNSNLQSNKSRGSFPGTSASQSAS